MATGETFDYHDDLAVAFFVLRVSGFAVDQLGIYVRGDSEIYVEVSFEDGATCSFEAARAPGRVDPNVVCDDMLPILETWNTLTDQEQYLRIANSPKIGLILDFLADLFGKGRTPPILAKGRFVTPCFFCRCPVLYDLENRRLTHDLPVCSRFMDNTVRDYATQASECIMDRLRRFGDLKTPDSSGDN